MIVELRGLELFGYHGVHDAERRDGQMFLYDIELEVGDRGADDQIESAVDYSRVAAAVREVVRARAREGARAQAGGAAVGDRRRVRSGDGRAVTVAYVGLGANLGDREESIREAAELIGAARISSIRETEPWGVTDQPLFLNAVAELDWPGSAEELLERLLEVERDLGRVRDGSRWGPREIDLDLLVFGSEAIDEPGLTVPHPELADRLFVLEPLAELAPELDVPGCGMVSDLLSKLQSPP